MSRYELSCISGMAKQNWLLRSEMDRFRDLVLSWKVANKADVKSPQFVFRELIMEDLLANHFLSQRLRNQKMFFDGTPTDARVVKSDKAIDLGEHDTKRKAAEWHKYYPILMKWKIELMKLCLANKIEIVGDLTASSLFSALDAEERKALDTFRDNGKRNKAESLYT